MIFFAYIGFDAVSTAAQESKNPQRDMPIGILGSLAICTVFYIAVAVVLTAIVNYTKLNVPDPVAVGIDAMAGYRWLGPFIKLGAVAGLSYLDSGHAVAQPRIFFSHVTATGCCRLLFPRFIRNSRPPTSRLSSPAWRSPWPGQPLPSSFSVTSSVSAPCSLSFSCTAGRPMAAYAQPDLPRMLRTPAAPVTCTLGILVCLGQMVFLPFETWERLIYWMALGIVTGSLLWLWLLAQQNQAAVPGRQRTNRGGRLAAAES